MNDKKIPPGALPEEVADDIPVKVLSCCRCLETKPVERFTIRLDRPRGYHYNCKDCAASAARDGRKSGTVNVDREAAIKRSRLWRKDNPSHHTYLTRKYKISKSGATPLWLSKEQNNQIKYYYDLAHDCQITSGQRYHVDHIIPLRGKDVCGLHVPWNLQILPEDLNRKKSCSYEQKI